ncbi:hypothetical protein McpCs1_03740 [Methanocorpusculaceae archaeon Cs1]|uniref:Uncharacterized protein n=1 Tax=Methanorbis rubei TaxID=3028300 RepID=A0AAE4MGG1_9EURY|nr:hypothetical protein [Methanocorpusculaceae archaeon Cs1]
MCLLSFGDANLLMFSVHSGAAGVLRAFLFSVKLREISVHSVVTSSETKDK